MHISNHKESKTFLESLFNFGLFNFHNQRFSLLFSFDLQAFPVSGHLLDLNERLFEIEEKIKENLFLSLFLMPHKNSLFSLYLLPAKDMFYVLK